MPPESALFTAMFPDRAGWDKTTMLLAEMVDTLHWLQWAKTKAGQNNRDRPQLVPRPGTVKKARPGLKPKAAPLSVVKARLAQRNGSDPDRADTLKKLFDGR
jgi:hypothetical protein